MVVPQRRYALAHNEGNLNGNRSNGLFQGALALVSTTIRKRGVDPVPPVVKNHLDPEEEKLRGANRLSRGSATEVPSSA